ncbi:thiol:disulfide interchange protein [Porphyromonas gingivicanis]|uniref:Thiol:disulfide interchange protein n=1 Tax=Porphyromonas gingivicanis TaxID=266762 RepID=A0A0A2G766_9PORP|nr:thiol:disulfide interchange protein [Porphyromonas gingivicanis]
MNKRIIYRLGFFSLLFTLLLSQGVEMKAQMHLDVLSWKATLEDKGTAEKKIIVTAKIKDGWHLYDQNMPEDGPNSTEFTFYKLEGARRVGGFVANRKAIEEYDKQFEMTLRFFDKQVSFVQNIVVTDPEKFYIELGVTAQACDDQACLPPATEEFTFKRSDLKSTAADTSVQEESTQTEADSAMSAITEGVGEAAEGVATQTALNEVSSDKLWTPVVDTLKAYGDETLNQTDSSLLELLLFGFLGGLVALITPCVWPMIPMTVSFFLKRTKDRKKAIKDAVIYGLGIVVIYLVLGLSVTLIFGASMLNNLATNAVFNLIFFAVLVLFAISFFGAFELVLPAKWTNKLDSKSDSTTGVLSLFFMAFTLVLVSFSCTGPIIGTLLVQAASMGDILGPAVGMFGFAVALALPFSLFAIFPNMLQNMPKSGGWLNSVKVVMAFLELALALKFLSIADLAYGWGILDRETFLALWIVIFTCLGLYLLGKITFPHDTPLEKVGIGRFFLALISLSFAVYMVPGLWGAPLKAVSAFSPPLSTQDFNLYDGQVHAKFDNYEEGMRYAKANNKPVLVDFSGFGCVNCREMENSVWINPQIKTLLEEDYVLITLMVDDKTPLPEVIEVEELLGNTVKRTKLRTIGDKWSYLQRSKFGANAQPFYIPLDHDGVPVGPSYQHDLDVDKYRTYLSDGIKEFKARQAGKPAPVLHTPTQKEEVEVTE